MRNKMTYIVSQGQNQERMSLIITDAWQLGVHFLVWTAQCHRRKLPGSEMKVGSVTVLVIPHPCLSVFLQDDISEAIKCVKIIVKTPQAIRAWYIGTLE